MNGVMSLELVTDKETNNETAGLWCDLLLVVIHYLIDPYQFHAHVVLLYCQCFLRGGRRANYALLRTSTSSFGQCDDQCVATPRTVESVKNKVHSFRSFA